MVAIAILLCNSTAVAYDFLSGGIPYNITDETNKKLEEDGYQLVKVPCFTLPEDPTINHLNGFGGTTTNGISYFITNKSDYPEIDKYVEQFYKQAGLDEIRFAKSSKAFLKNFGGMDCLTIEM